MLRAFLYRYLAVLEQSILMDFESPGGVHGFAYRRSKLDSHFVVLRSSFFCSFVSFASAGRIKRSEKRRTRYFIKNENSDSPHSVKKICFLPRSSGDFSITFGSRIVVAFQNGKVVVKICNSGSCFF